MTSINFPMEALRSPEHTMKVPAWSAPQVEPTLHFVNLNNQKIAESTANLEREKVLPKLEVVDARQAKKGQVEAGPTFAEGAGRVGKDLWDGAVDEVKNHKGRILRSFLIGAAVGAATVLLAPGVVLSLSVGAAAYTGYRLAQAAPRWYHDAKIVADPRGHSAEDLARAHGTIRGVGAGSVDVAAGVAGGFTGRILTKAAVEAVKTATTVTVTDGQDHSQVLNHDQTSSLFDKLRHNNGEYTFVKKPYTVTIRDGVPGEHVVDVQGKSQLVEAGKHVIQRIMPDGKIDTYPIDHQTFLSRWQPTNTPGVYAPKPVPTTMVQLDKAVTIPGHAGPQLGSPGDMLATDGTKFWTVQKAPLVDTYQGVDKASQAVIDALAGKK